MHSILVALRGNPSLALCSLIGVNYLHHVGLLDQAQWEIRDARTIDDDDATVQANNHWTDLDALKHLVEISTEASKSLDIDRLEEWVIRGDKFSTRDFKTLHGKLVDLDTHLTLRVFVVGESQSLADLFLWASLTVNHAAKAWIKRNSNNVTRWYNYIESTNPWIQDCLATSRGDHIGDNVPPGASTNASYDIELPDVSGPIITRFPPEPSGYLHIGHAKAVLLNDYFARLRPGGKLICRFDDTNPSNESDEFEQSIVHDLKLIGVLPDQVTHSSDYFQAMYKYAIKLIKDGKAFADDAVLGKGDETRKSRLPSARRDMSIKDTLSKFQEMKSGSEEGRRWVLRARIAFDSPNGTLRDPVIYRCNATPHHRTGLEWKIYPTYDFCAPILDALEGVNLALRTNEYRDRDAQYAWIQGALGLRPVPIWDFSRLNFVRTVLSKRKLTRIVDLGNIHGWDDPRMPTIRGTLRSGITAEALRDFILKQGPSRNVLNMQWGALWATNRKILNPKSPRHTAIVQDKVVRCDIDGISKTVTLNRDKHPKNPGLGKKKVVYSNKIMIEYADAQGLKIDDEITLMNWGNAKVQRVDEAPDGSVCGLGLYLHLNGDVKSTERKLTWLTTEDNQSFAVDLVSFDHLLNKDKLAKKDNLEDWLNPATETCEQAFADGNVADLRSGDVVQFERKGFYILDKACDGPGSRAVFFEIPPRSQPVLNR